jgi:hypothetical protein
MSIDDTNREKYDVTHQAHEATACGEAEILYALLRQNDILSCVTEVSKSKVHFESCFFLACTFLIICKKFQSIIVFAIDCRLGGICSIPLL